MIRRLSDFGRSIEMLDEFERRMNRLFEEFDVARWPEFPVWRTVTWPQANLYDRGKELVLCADVPGLTEKNIQITANQEMVTLTGERDVDVPEGYSVHRQERGRVKFSRTFTMPCRVDAEKTSASVKNGVLTITLAKAPEAQPRQISVKAD